MARRSGFSTGFQEPRQRESADSSETRFQHSSTVGQAKPFAIATMEVGERVST